MDSVLQSDAIRNELEAFGAHGIELPGRTLQHSLASWLTLSVALSLEDLLSDDVIKLRLRDAGSEAEAWKELARSASAPPVRESAAVEAAPRANRMATAAAPPPQPAAARSAFPSVPQRAETATHVADPATAATDFITAKEQMVIDALQKKDPEAAAAARKTLGAKRRVPNADGSDGGPTAPVQKKCVESERMWQANSTGCPPLLLLQRRKCRARRAAMQR